LSDVKGVSRFGADNLSSYGRQRCGGPGLILEQLLWRDEELVDEELVQETGSIKEFRRPRAGLATVSPPTAPGLAVLDRVSQIGGNEPPRVRSSKLNHSMKSRVA
jgi:hypothetical protein